MWHGDTVGYREFPVPLGGWAECGWTVTGAAGDRPVLPDGAMDLVWTGAELLVAGPDTAPHPARLPPGTIATGIRFRPGVLPALLGVPAHLLRDRRVPLAALHPGVAMAALARMPGPRSPDGPIGDDRADAGSPGYVPGGGSPGTDVPPRGVRHDPAGAAPSAGADPARATVAAALVRAARSLPGSADRALLVASARLGAGMSAADTADALGWTTRTLHRRSLAAFGYGPAVLRRVLRFRRAVALLHAGCSPAVTAARAGYADQPHLSREVRALSGRSPAELIVGPDTERDGPRGRADDQLGRGA